MFGIGGFELFIILLFAFLVFGPDKLPEMAKTLGAALNKFKKAQEEMQAVINDEVLNPDESAKKAANGSSKPAPHASQESFAERKARYDKERAERLKKQQVEANRAAMKAEAAKRAEELQAEEAAKDGAQPAEAAADAKAEAPVASKLAPKAQAAVAAKPAAPALTPDELFGTKPVKPAPRAVRAEAVASKEAE